MEIRLGGWLSAKALDLLPNLLLPLYRLAVVLQKNNDKGWKSEQEQPIETGLKVKRAAFALTITIRKTFFVKHKKVN